MTSKTKRLRELIAQDKMIVAPGAQDALCARIIEKAGFDVCYMSGNGSVASMLGKPDIGLATFDEMLTHAKNIAACIDIPLICDADTGYGNVNNVIRTVQAYERAGIAGIHIEDQVTPKKCGAMDGVELIPLEESVEKIKAAVYARQDPDFVVIARTDSRSVLGLDEAIRRVKAFEKAGADIVFAEMLQSKEEVSKIVESVNVPVLFDMLEQTENTFITNDELEELGVKITIYPLSATFRISQAITDLMTELKNTGTTQGSFNSMMKLHDYEELLDIGKEQEYQKMFKN